MCGITAQGTLQDQILYETVTISSVGRVTTVMAKNEGIQYKNRPSMLQIPKYVKALMFV